MIDIETRQTRTRRRLLVTLFAASGINRTAFIAAITVAPLAAEDLLGSARWSGAATAVATLGLALGVAPLAAFMARRGRRPGFSVALSVAAAGAAVAGVAVRLESFPLLMLAMLLFGLGSSGDRLSRYAAADVAPAHLRASAISAIVWSGTVGSVAGPLLLGPSETLARSLGFPSVAGGFLVAAGLIAVSVLILTALLRPDPLAFAEGSLQSDGGGIATAVAVPSLLRLPLMRYALVSLAIGQFVMVLIMAMTPIHIRAAGEDLTLVGLVIGAHTFGMFFFSPVTGWLSDRFGSVPVIVAGQLLLVSAALLAAPAGGDDRTLLLVALFLLGVGWNFGFVAASALVSSMGTGAARVRVQGVADAATWISGAVAAVSSGIILDWQSYGVLAAGGAAATIAALILRVWYRAPLASRTPTQAGT